VKEKEWLLKEVHHRVKNNLQIIMSLLNSQSAYLDNDAALLAIRNSQQRIHAISLIHQKLYQSDNMSSIDMPVYIRELVEYLRDSFTTGQLIRFKLDVDPIELDVSQAVPLGLILNEAITNAIKYAFPGGRPGLISITLRHYTVSRLSLIISDNGAGIPDAIVNRPASSLGLSLMKGLTEEIAGAFCVENNQGTLIKVAFVSMQPVQQPITINTFIANAETTSVYE
jgi:two-component sensor histidine kinase